MRRLIGLTAGLAALLFSAMPSSAVVVGDLGINPTSNAGAFSTANPGADLPTGLFSQEWTFELVGGPVFLAVANAGNTFANGPADKITAFMASIFRIVGAIDNAPGGDDEQVLGPQAAQQFTYSQILEFSGLILGAGNYYLQFTGNAGSNAGYGGNLSVAPVPVPAALPLFGAALAGLAALRYRRRRTA